MCRTATEGLAMCHHTVWWRFTVCLGYARVCLTIARFVEAFSRNGSRGVYGVLKPFCSRTMMGAKLLPSGDLA